MTTEELTDWLKKADKTRQWLAKEMNISVKAVEKWYYRGFIPAAAQRTIALIQDAQRKDSVASPKFTFEEFQVIQEAANDAGCTLKEFIEKAAIRLAEQASEYKVKPKGKGDGEGGK